MNLEHRGACGCEKNTGDGAGILMQMPHGFLARGVRDRSASSCPPPGEYGVGMVFLPHDPGSRAACEHLFEQVVARRGPDRSSAGARCRPTTACSARPRSGRSRSSSRSSSAAAPDVDRRRRVRAQALRDPPARRDTRCARSTCPSKASFYIPSLSCTHHRLQGDAQLPSSCRSSIPDLRDDRRRVGAGAGALALLAPTRSRAGRARIPTATSPTTARSTRCAATSTGCTRARACSSRSCSATTSRKICPVIDTDGSDSAMFDNALELLVLAGRSLPHAMMMMIPEPWSNHESMSQERKAFYEYHACLMEPWDGPASIAFTDGIRIGADARPQRPAPVALLRHQGRPGRHGVRGRRARHPAGATSCRRAGCSRAACSWSTPTQGRIVADEEIKQRDRRRSSRTAQWLKRQHGHAGRPARSRRR